MRVITQGRQHCSFSADFTHLRVKWHGTFKKYKLIDHELAAQGAADAIERDAALLPRLNAFAVFVPEVFRQLQHAGVKQV